METQMSFRFLALSPLLMASAIIPSVQQRTDKPAKISMKQARSAATARVPGKTKSSELEKEHGKRVYPFDIDTPAGICEIQVDAYSGAIVPDQIETVADEAKEAAQEEKDRINEEGTGSDLEKYA